MTGPRRGWIVNIALATASLVLTCAVAEVALRRLGYQPAARYFSIVEHVQWTPSFIGFPDGTFRANPRWSWDSIAGVNQDGFRGTPLQPASAVHTSIMLIGDSFVWGASAKPLSNSFADLLAADGFQVFNLGIPGTGPTQYRALAERYVPQVKPDYVIVVLYLGNDIKPPDPLTPNHPLYYVTNAGWLQAHSPAGRPLTVEQAYRSFIGVSRLDAVRSLATRSALATFLYRKIRRARRSAPAPAADQIEYARNQLQAIQQTAQSVGSQFGLVILPAYGKGCEMITNVQGVPRPLQDFPTIASDLPAQTFGPAPDCHIDNEGHRLVAAKIEEFVRRNVRKRGPTAHAR
jgi:lysophospholipase L1-like esterase